MISKVFFLPIYSENIFTIQIFLDELNWECHTLIARNDIHDFKHIANKIEGLINLILDKVLENK